MARRAISDLDVLLACEEARQRREQHAARPFVDAVLADQTGQSRADRQLAIRTARERGLIGRDLPEEIWIEEEGALLLLEHFRQLPTYDRFAEAALAYLCQLARSQAYGRVEDFMDEAARRNVKV